MRPSVTRTNQRWCWPRRDSPNGEQLVKDPTPSESAPQVPTRFCSWKTVCQERLVSLADQHQDAGFLLQECLAGP